MSTSTSGKRFLKAGDVDREKVAHLLFCPYLTNFKTCPLLLRIFHKVGGHHRVEDFDRRGREPTQDEVTIYTWKDATLRELTDLIKEVQPAARHRNAKLSFAFIYPDKSGRMVHREVGQCWGSNKREEKDDYKTLDELHFETGDFLDVAVYI